MAWLGPRAVGTSRPRLQDPPPGYHPPHGPAIPLKEQQRRTRRDWVIVRVAAAVLILAAAAFIVMVFVIIATHS
jgi:hypothetical protein